VLCSGGGTTLQNLIDRISSGRMSASLATVVVSAEDAYAATRAKDAGIPVQFIAPRPADAASEAIFDVCRKAGADLVLLAGYLHLLKIPPDFERRVLNVHPSLIPSFCGKGFYGRKVHAAALERGVKLSGCTVHYADDRYDHGPILVQKAVPVLPDDTPETLAARVFAAECEAFPQGIALAAAALEAERAGE
jgi:phosphoribosylglycinamide formyltransferase-1